MSNKNKNIHFKNVESDNYTPTYYASATFNRLRCIKNYWGPSWGRSFEANLVFDGCYVGALPSVYDKKLLKEKNITHIVSAVPGFSPPYPEDFKYLVIGSLDNKTAKLSTAFTTCNKFINEAFDQRSNVLIHCIAGRSRSATICSAFMIDKFGMEVDDCLRIIKAKRSIIEPNSGFVEQLNYYRNHKKCLQKIIADS
mgnify:CR=1 FL=1